MLGVAAQGHERVTPVSVHAQPGELSWVKAKPPPPHTHTHTESLFQKREAFSRLTGSHWCESCWNPSFVHIFYVFVFVLTVILLIGPSQPGAAAGGVALPSHEQTMVAALRPPRRLVRRGRTNSAARHVTGSDSDTESRRIRTHRRTNPPANVQSRTPRKILKI